MMSGPSEQTPSTEGKPPAGARRVVVWIMLAVILWGGLLAAGTYLYRYEERPDGIEDQGVAGQDVARHGVARQRAVRRAVVVLGCTGGFLGFWGVALALRSAGNSGGRRGSG